MTGPEHGFTRQELEKAILGETPSLTSADVADAAGVSVEHTRRLWRALGFPDAGEEIAFTDADMDALTTLLGAIEKGAIDFYAWRRHLAAAVARIEALGANDDDLHTTQVTVGFADLVRFTALSNELDDDRIGDLVEIFESRCADVVAASRGRVIKTLGDSVLFVSEDPSRAMEIALGIVDVIGRDGRLPDVRIGLATGSVIMQLGDVFGPPVNLAARLTGVARRNRVITDRRTAELLPPAQFESRPLPARPLRGFGVVEPVAVRRH